MPFKTPTTTFQGLPLLPSYIYNERHLARCLEVIHRALDSSSRVLAVRLDLRFPQAYWPVEGEVLGNDYIRRFFRGLDQRLEWHMHRAGNQNKRAHPPHLRYVWVREYDQSGSKPHYHILLLVNHAAYRSLGWLNSSGRHNLMTAVVESWATALGYFPLEAPGLVNVPDNHCYVLERGNHANLANLFYRVSYLCKTESKSSEAGCRSFGSSNR